MLFTMRIETVEQETDALLGFVVDDIWHGEEGEERQVYSTHDGRLIRYSHVT